VLVEVEVLVEVDVLVDVVVEVVVDVDVLALGLSVTFIHSGAISSRSRCCSVLPGWPK
jgi:hypothetical protein